MSRHGAFLLLAASSCAAITGLGDYEVGDDALLDGGRPDGGLTSAPSDARASTDGTIALSDGNVIAAPDASRVPTDAGMDATTSGPTCGRVSCVPSSATCTADACGDEKVWDNQGMDPVFRRIAGRCVMQKKGFLEAQLAGASSFAFEVGFKVGAVSATTEGNILELGAGGNAALTIVVANGKLKLCASTTSCTLGYELPPAASSDSLDVDVYGVYAENTWTAYLSVGTNVCPGAASVKSSAGAGNPVRLKLGCTQNTDECALAMDDATFSVIPK
ncbi:MAG: hypothetical protein U0270_40625 [Labilithrix sp.]